MGAPPEPLVGPTLVEEVGRNCPYCRFPLKEGAASARCGSCHASHHADCWGDNGGCAVIGCASAPGASTTVSVAAVAPFQAAPTAADRVGAAPEAHPANGVPRLAAPIPTG